MIGLISRLTDQKGLDLVRYAMDKIIDDNTQVVVIGTGDPAYEEMFRYYAWCNSDKVSANILYSDDLAHKLYAAADSFLIHPYLNMWFNTDYRFPLWNDSNRSRNRWIKRYRYSSERI